VEKKGAAMVDLDLRSPHQRRTTISIDVEDFDYIQKHNLKPSHMIRAAVREHKVSMNDPQAIYSAREVFRKMKVWQELAQGMRDFLEKKDLIDEYFQIGKFAKEKVK
jgi:hypothetical protein